MSDLSAEAVATLQSELHRRLGRIRRARPCRATTETRVALVAFERGLTERQLEQFYFVNRKGSKSAGSTTAPSPEKYDINIHWLWDGDLCGHPRGMTRKQPRKNSRPPAQP
jgi:hypothetical protein